MDVILGIDIGGSTTKIVGLDTKGTVLSMLRVRAEDQVTSLYGALGNYLTSNRLSLKDVRRVVLTGVGASYVDGDIYGLPTCKVDEFSASGTGALALDRLPRRMVVLGGGALMLAGPVLGGGLVYTRLITGALALAAGLCAAVTVRDNYRGTQVPKYSFRLLMPAYAFCVWLIAAYQVRAGDPVRLDYVYELFAIITGGTLMPQIYWTLWPIKS